MAHDDASFTADFRFLLSTSIMSDVQNGAQFAVSHKLRLVLQKLSAWSGDIFLLTMHIALSLRGGT